MFKKESTARALLPWYVNGTLTQAEKDLVEAWLRAEPKAEAELAAWQRLGAKAVAQPQVVPPVSLWAKVHARVRVCADQSGWVSTWLPRAWGVSMAVMVLIVLCLIVQPGISLHWSVEQGQVAGFRVYRAPAGSNDFALLSQVAARPDTQQYFFVDMLLVPWQGYVYLVEGIAPDGSTALTPMATARAVEALPAQLMVLCISLLAGFWAMFLARQRWSRGQTVRQTA